jgi:hypothetical protein
MAVIWHSSSDILGTIRHYYGTNMSLIWVYHMAKEPYHMAKETYRMAKEAYSYGKRGTIRHYYGTNMSLI